MPYILNKTDGTVLTTVQDASLDITTDLFFVGRNYAGYGEWQNENFLKLLENFSNTIPPEKPVKGQLWYDVTNRRINVYDDVNWKAVANIEVSTTNPVDTKSFVSGDLWFDDREKQVHVFNGEDFILVGPPSGSDTKAYWGGDVEYGEQDPGTPKFNIKSVIGANNDVIAIVSAETYTVAQPTQEPFPRFPIYTSETTATIAKGITLVGSDHITGESASKGIYFWGSARHAVEATTASFAVGFALTPTPITNNILPIPYTTSTVAGQASAVYTTSSFYYNPGENSVTASLFNGVATSAYYADIAERYEADAIYEPGTVLMHGGEKEVTLSTEHATTAVAGVVSTNPAYMMNSAAGNDETHPYIALKGRVPCKVIGPVKKGDLLVSSGHKHGYAVKKLDHDSSDAVIGKALENFEGPFGLIEIKV